MSLNSSNRRYSKRVFARKQFGKLCLLSLALANRPKPETRNSNTLTCFSFKTEGFINQYNIATYRHLLRESLESVLGVMRVHLAAVWANEVEHNDEAARRRCAAVHLRAAFTVCNRWLWTRKPQLRWAQHFRRVFERSVGQTRCRHVRSVAPPPCYESPAAGPTHSQ